MSHGCQRFHFRRLRRGTVFGGGMRRVWSLRGIVFREAWLGIYGQCYGVLISVELR